MSLGLAMPFPDSVSRPDLDEVCWPVVAVCSDRYPAADHPVLSWFVIDDWHTLSRVSQCNDRARLLYCFPGARESSRVLSTSGLWVSSIHAFVEPGQSLMTQLEKSLL